MKNTKTRNLSLNLNLNRAKVTKNDEFYTLLKDIENELQYYKKSFKNKIIFCNCDNPEKSNFFKYFTSNFKELGLKKLITTYYNKGGISYKLEIIGDKSIKTPLKGDGDFRGQECISILKNVDIVVTNPPFSLFREYIDVLEKYNKKFLIIGSLNAGKNKVLFELIKNNEVQLGHTYPQKFLTPQGKTKKFGNITWYTNLETNKKHEDIPLYKVYNEEEYPKYDNCEDYNIINVDRVKEIPMDYAGCIGVPISFMMKYSPEQFEIMGIDRDYLKKITGKPGRFKINGKEKYARIVIKHKKSALIST